MTQSQTQSQPAVTACDDDDILAAIMAATEERAQTQTPDPLAAAREALAKAEAEAEAMRREMGVLRAEAEKAQAVKAKAQARTAQPATAKAQPYQGTLAATPKMLRDGTWGARVDDGEPTPKVGDKVTIRTKSGKRWTGYVTQRWGRTFAYSRKAPKAKVKRQCIGNDYCRMYGWAKGPNCAP